MEAGLKRGAVYLCECPYPHTAKFRARQRDRTVGSLRMPVATVAGFFMSAFCQKVIRVNSKFPLRTRARKIQRHLCITHVYARNRAYAVNPFNPERKDASLLEYFSFMRGLTPQNGQLTLHSIAFIFVAITRFGAFWAVINHAIFDELTPMHNMW